MRRRPVAEARLITFRSKARSKRVENYLEALKVQGGGVAGIRFSAAKRKRKHKGDVANVFGKLLSPREGRFLFSGKTVKLL